MTRRKLIAANWKMNKTAQESVSFVNEFRELAKKIKNEIVIYPPFTSLPELNKAIKNTNILLGAQNMHQEEKGAFTGEVSASMLKNSGCEYVILGHSERRAYFNESDELINKKTKAALKNTLKIIRCIGETLQQRESSQAMKTVESQLKTCLKNISNEEIKSITIAYEPVWAIGTGKTATPEQAEEMHKFIRQMLKKLFNEKISLETRIIYGGSVNESNAKALLSMEDIDGALVGGASLDAKGFAKICEQ